MMARAVLVETRMRDGGFANPTLNILHEDDALATVALLQPQADVIANDRKIGPRDCDTALAKVSAFLKNASERHSDLALTPEYYAPWSLVSQIGTALQPPVGALWAICFESIKPSELNSIIETNLSFEWICNTPNAVGEKELLNCLVYFFQTCRINSEEKRIIALVQFKTAAMSDTALQLERRKLILGDEIFVFRNREFSINLSSIICSDALAFDPTTFHDSWGQLPHILLHPQFNTNPIYEQFRDYRTRWSRQIGDKKQIIALNWARNSSINQSESNLEHYGRSCFYTKDILNFGHHQHRHNHDNGLYYTIGADRVHSFYLNFDEYAFDISICKVGRSGIAAAAANPAAPRISAYNWQNGAWLPHSPIDSGFLPICPWSINPIPAALTGATLHQLEKEIIINHATGYFSGNEGDFSSIKSVQLGNGEIIHRLTFLHDQSEAARTRRQSIFSKFLELCNILTNQTNFPVNLKYCSRTPKLGIYPQGHNLKGGNPETSIVAFLGSVPEDEARRYFAQLYKDAHPGDKRKICVWFKVGDTYKMFFEEDTSTTNPMDSQLTDMTRQ